MDTSTGGDGSSNKNSSSTASTKGVGVKQKTDIAWNYFEDLIDENGNKVFRCLFCAKVYKGGGINRMKQHLAGIPGQISRCLKVPYDVREKIQNNLTEFNLNKIEKKKADASVGMTFHENRDINDVVQNDAPVNTMNELTRSGSSGPAREGWKEIVRPAVTRFATHFEVLKSTFAHRADLRALFGSEFYIADSSSSTQKAMNVEKIVLDNMFWGDCLEIVKVVTPIMKLLRFVDSDEKPSLGYVYKGMTLIIEGIKNIYPDNESKYKPYIDIVEKWFDKHFRGDMHRAAYYFNPALAYDRTATPIEFVKPAVLNLFELKTYCTDGMAAVKELKIYEEAKGSFGRELAIRGRSELHPGNSVMAKDHYNTEKLNTDPFDSEWISSTDFWVLDDQGSTPTPELNYEDLMAALDEEMGRTTIGADEGTSRKRRRTEDDAMSSTGSDSEDVADIGDEVAQAENLMDTGPSGVGRDDQDTRYLFDDTSLF
ncbi:hypothetical protein LINPERHAP2_LOCUS9570 [Linum perenne]